MKNRKFLVLSIGPAWLLSMVVLLASGAHGKQPSISSLPVNIQSIQESDSFFRVHYSSQVKGRMAKKYAK